MSNTNDLAGLLHHHAHLTVENDWPPDHADAIRLVRMAITGGRDKAAAQVALDGMYPDAGLDIYALVSRVLPGAAPVVEVSPDAAEVQAEPDDAASTSVSDGVAGVLDVTDLPADTQTVTDAGNDPDAGS
jgi:hypothetical protein